MTDRCCFQESTAAAAAVIAAHAGSAAQAAAPSGVPGVPLLPPDSTRPASATAAMAMAAAYSVNPTVDPRGSSTAGRPLTRRDIAAIRKALVPIAPATTATHAPSTDKISTALMGHCARAQGVKQRCASPMLPGFSPPGQSPSGRHRGADTWQDRDDPRVWFRSPLGAASQDPAPSATAAHSAPTTRL